MLTPLFLLDHVALSQCVGAASLSRYGVGCILFGNAGIRSLIDRPKMHIADESLVVGSGEFLGLLFGKRQY